MSLVGLVVNPVAGHGRGSHAGQAVHDRLTAAGHAVRDLSGPTLAHAADRARAAVLAGLDALVVVGGDGMVHLGVGLVAGTALPLGVVAVGTGNDAARALGLPRGDVRAATDVVEAALRARRTRTVDAARTGRPGAGAHEWFLGVLSCGLDAAVNARANTLRRPRGSTRYLAALVPELARFRPYGYRVRVDDVLWEQPGTLVAVANAPWFGGGMHVAPDARLDDGQLDVVLAGAFTRAGAVRVFPRLYGGSHVRDRRVQVVRGRTVVVEAAPRHGPAPPPAFADGERVGPLPLAVECVPGALRVLV